MLSFPLDKVNIEFVTPEDTRALFEVYTVKGVRISTLFDGDVIGNALYRFEFSNKLNPDNVLFKELQFLLVFKLERLSE